MHTLHLKGLLELQEKGEQVKTWPSRPEDRAWLPVRLQVDLQVVGAGEGGFALLAAVLLITCGREDDSLERRRAEKQRGGRGSPTSVQFDVAVPAALVLEQATAEGALERQLVAVDLLVALQVAQTARERERENRADVSTPRGSSPSPD